MRSGFGYAAGPLSSAETGRCRAGLEVTCTGREVGYSPRTTTSPKPRRLLELSTARRARPPSVRVQLRDLSAEDVDHRLATKAKTLSLAARSRSLLHTAYLLTGDWEQGRDLLQTAPASTARRWSQVRDREQSDFAAVRGRRSQPRWTGWRRP